MAFLAQLRYRLYDEGIVELDLRDVDQTNCRRGEV